MAAPEGHRRSELDSAFVGSTGHLAALFMSNLSTWLNFSGLRVLLEVGSHPSNLPSE
jgi:hypothetical protein